MSKRPTRRLARWRSRMIFRTRARHGRPAEQQAIGAYDLDLMRRIDALHLEVPVAGARMLRRLLRGARPSLGRTTSDIRPRYALQEDGATSG